MYIEIALRDDCELDETVFRYIESGLSVSRYARDVDSGLFLFRDFAINFTVSLVDTCDIESGESDLPFQINL